MQNFFLPKKNYLIFGNLLKIAQISKKKSEELFQWGESNNHLKKLSENEGKS